MANFKFDGDDLGGELLSVLSEGLYSNPLHALREYVQNSLDARTKDIEIKVTGRSVYIEDTGTGMSYDQLRAACQLGISMKSLIALQIGFRGIGIYSSFHICDILRITTKLAGSKAVNIVELDFKQMRRTLEKQRQDRTTPRISLPNLLSKHNQVLADEDKDIKKHYTIVELSGVVDPYFAVLQSVDSVEEYLLNTITVPFDPKIEPAKMRKDIEKFLKGHVPDYREIDVTLRFDGVKARKVLRRLPPSLQLQTIISEYPAGSKARVVAWGAMNTDRKALPKLANGADVAGFVQKYHGFTVGDREVLRRYFKVGSGTTYRWLTGEVHILTDDVKPNAARDDFESGLARTRLEDDLTEALKKFGVATGRYSKIGNVKDALKTAGTALPRLRRQVETATELTSTVEALQSLAHTLKRQKKNASLLGVATVKRFDELLRTLASLEKRLRARLRKPGKAALRQKPPAPGELTDEGAAETSAETSPASGADSRTLFALLEPIDWADIDVIVGVLKRLAELVDATLSGNPSMLRDLVETLEADLEIEGLV